MPNVAGEERRTANWPPAVAARALWWFRNAGVMAAGMVEAR